MRAISATAMDLLAAGVKRRDLTNKATPGTKYARLSGSAKSVARREVLSLFTPTAWPTSLRILTFPSVRWEFEVALLVLRGHGRRMGNMLPTQIVGMEREDRIYRSALRYLPHTGQVTTQPRPPHVRHAIATNLITRYYCCEFERYARSGAARKETGEGKNQPVLFDAAWLDFNGPLTVQRAEAVASFRLGRCREFFRLVLTFMDGRWDHDSERFWGRDKETGVCEWLDALGAVRRLHAMRYRAGRVSMIQVAADFA